MVLAYLVRSIFLITCSTTDAVVPEFHLAWAYSGLSKERSNKSFKVTFLKNQLNLKGEMNSGNHNVQRLPIMEVSEVVFLSLLIELV